MHLFELFQEKKGKLLSDSMIFKKTVVDNGQEKRLFPSFPGGMIRREIGLSFYRRNHEFFDESCIRVTYSRNI